VILEFQAKVYNRRLSVTNKAGEKSMKDTPDGQIVIICPSFRPFVGQKLKVTVEVPEKPVEPIAPIEPAIGVA
jgi:hypothetical protein